MVHTDSAQVGGRQPKVHRRVFGAGEAGIGHIALRVRALSGSTRPGVRPRTSIERGIEAMERFGRDVLPLPG